MKIDMTPSEYFSQFVEPNWQDYIRNKTSLRLAANVAISSYHMVDYIARAEERTETGSVCARAEAKCPHFGIIQQIANAFKHSERTRQSKSKTPDVITDVLQISHSHSEPFSDCTFFSDNTGWHSDEPRITAIAPTGELHDFECCMEMVIKAWQGYLAKGDF